MFEVARRWVPVEEYLAQEAVAECSDPQGSLPLESIGCTLELPRV